MCARDSLCVSVYVYACICACLCVCTESTWSRTSLRLLARRAIQRSALACIRACQKTWQELHLYIYLTVMHVSFFAVHVWRNARSIIPACIYVHWSGACSTRMAKSTVCLTDFPKNGFVRVCAWYIRGWVYAKSSQQQQCPHHEKCSRELADDACSANIIYFNHLLVLLIELACEAKAIQWASDETHHNCGECRVLTQAAQKFASFNCVCNELSAWKWVKLIMEISHKIPISTFKSKI